MKKIYSTMCLVFISMGVLCPGYAASLEQIIAEMKDYETNARKQITDMTIFLEFKAIAKGKESIGYELVLRKGEKYRVERTQPDTLFGSYQELLPVTTFDGKTIWTFDRSGTKTSVTFDDWRLRPYLTWDWSSLISLKSRLVSVDEVGGQSTYYIELPPGWLNLPFKSIWVDYQKPLLVRAQSTKMLLVYSEFQPVFEEIELPYRSETFAGGGDFITLTTVKSVEINQGMEDDLFNPDSPEATSLRLPATLNRLQLIEEEQQ